MINPGRSYNINDYKEIFLRRKLYFVIPFVLIFTAAILWAALAPRKYQASTLVLVTPQRVPADLVRSTVTAGIIERLNSISQEIMSRTRLEQIIDELKLYQGEQKTMKREEVVELMRKNIKVELPKRTAETAGYFNVSYTGEDPRIVTLVANKLASLFIEENLKQREQQAVGTTEFLTNELASTKEKLEAQGQTLADYKRRNMGSLPEQRDTNIKILEQLQLQAQRNEESTRALEDRKLLILKQMAEIENPPLAVPEKGGGPVGPAGHGKRRGPDRRAEKAAGRPAEPLHRQAPRHRADEEANRRSREEQGDPGREERPALPGAQCRACGDGPPDPEAPGRRREAARPDAASTAAASKAPPSASRKWRPCSRSTTTRACSTTRSSRRARRRSRRKIWNGVRRASSSGSSIRRGSPRSPSSPTYRKCF